MTSTTSTKIIMYSTDWCGDCVRSKAHLDKLKVNYLEVNIEEDPKAAQKVTELNHGNTSVPTIIFPSGKILVEPTNHQLTQTLISEKIIKS